MLVTVIQFYIRLYLYIHLHNNDSVYHLEPDAHAQKSTAWLRSLVLRPHPSHIGKGVWLQYDIPLDPVT